MAIELAKAYVQIVPSAKGISKGISDALGGEAEKGGREGGKKFSAAFAGAAKIGAAAVGAVSAAVGAIAKSAVSSFADYEQLVGGVETLFSSLDGSVSAAPTVLANAEKAYRTAGMSANQYMETVTSFSAALVSSLGGDYAKAASISDMAITDMADNANKMGTSMDSIQNAYQGFAKQNYTMLDNLKLGYGGTKTEMERLLKDASEISGVDYGIDSLNDVYAAIHVIQGEMGITGTTAKEAAGTISGSLASVKASWENTLTAAASGEGFGQAIGGLIESAGNLADNLMPVITQSLSGISQAVTLLAPRISEALPQLITDTLPGLLDAGSQLLDGLTTGLVNSLPTLTASALDTVTTLATSILAPENIETMVTTAISIIDTLATGLTDALPTLVPAAIGAIIALAENLTSPDNLTTLVNTAIDLMITLTNSIVAAIPQLIAAAPQILQSLGTAIISNLPRLLSAGKQIITTIAGAARSAFSQITEVGKNIITGIWNGISNAADWLWEKVKGWASGLLDNIKGVFGIHSPSTVTAGFGLNLVAGLGKGWEKAFPGVARMISGDLAGISAFGAEITAEPAYEGVIRSAAPARYAAEPLEGNAAVEILGVLRDIRDAIPDRLGIDGREVSDVVDRYLGIKAIRRERGN